MARSRGVRAVDTMQDHLERIVLAVVVVLTSACSAERPAPAASTSRLVGRWIRVYPAEGAPDTLELHADGTASGSAAGLDSSAYAPRRWKVGDALMPGGFCLGEGDQPDGRRLWSCTGFRLAGDTFQLANLRQSAFLRAPADGRRLVVTPWTSPRGTVAAPRLGERVEGIAPARDR